LYFPAIGWSASRRDRKEDTAPNRRHFIKLGVVGTGAVPKEPGII
jgi:hypothetical protein